MQRHGADVHSRGTTAGVADSRMGTTTRSTTVTSTDYPAPRAPDSNLADPVTRPMPPGDRHLT
jgi:hypothetical protein